MKGCHCEGLRLISFPWHPGWHGWFADTLLQQHCFSYKTTQTAGSHSTACFLQQPPSCSCTLKPHTTTLTDAISIFHGRGALKSTGLGISALRSLHYSLPSLVAGLICVDKGLDGIVIQSVLLRFNYFYPHCGSCGSGMTSLLHFHVESFIRSRARGWPPPKSAPCTHQSHFGCSCWLSLHQIWNQTVCNLRKMSTWWHFSFSETFKCYICPRSQSCRLITQWETSAPSLPGRCLY